MPIKITVYYMRGDMIIFESLGENGQLVKFMELPVYPTVYAVQYEV